MNTNEVKLMLEYVKHKMDKCKTADECREVLLNAIGICESHNFDQLMQEFGPI